MNSDHLGQEKEVIVDIRNLCYSSNGHEIFHGFNGEIWDGEKAGVVMAAGADNVALFHFVTGMLKPDSGIVSVFGQDLSLMNERDILQTRSRIGCVFQDGALISNLKVIENVTLPLLHHTRMTEDEIFEKGRMLLDKVGYDGDIWELPGPLSLFRKKLVGIARGLALEPEIIIYDRLLEGLDSRQRRFMVEMIESCHTAKAGRISIYSSYEMEELGQMKFDRLFQIGATREH